MQVNRSRLITPFSDALSDINASLKNSHIFLTIGWQDVATRYRRSRVGAFWLTINMLVMVTVLGTVFSTLFRSPASEFLPSIAVGIVIWGFISGIITEGCEAYSSVRESVLQVKMPLSIHIFRVIVRNTIIFGHNFIIIPLVFIFFMKPVDITALLSLLGVMLIIINTTWMVFFISIICTRYRDMTQVLQNVMQVLFYVTPIIWSSEMLPDRYEQSVLYWNPFYHLLTVVRAPLLGEYPTTLNWLIPVIMAIVGWFFAIMFFNIYRKRIPYWL